MADDKKKKSVPENAADEKLNQARAEFEKYRQRMGPYWAAAAAPPPGPGMPLLGGPIPGAFAPGPLPPYPGGGPFSYAGAPTAFPPQAAGSPIGGSGPLFENIGRMLQMGVAFATTAFAGGMQLMQGFSGQSRGGHHEHPCQCAPVHSGECDCHPDDHACCCDDYDCCCTPGVSNCGCDY
jgi:hypothetical protein